MKSRFASARAVFEAYPELFETMQAAPDDTPLLDFLQKLHDSKTPEDAITLAPYSLDKREAVWWASQCCRTLGRPQNREEDVALLTAEAWIRDPEEHRRIAAYRLGFKGDHAIPGVWVALSAGGAGAFMPINGNSGPPMPPGLTARAARNAVLLALAKVPYKDRQTRIGECVTFCRTLLQRP